MNNKEEVDKQAANKVNQLETKINSKNNKFIYLLNPNKLYISCIVKKNFFIIDYKLINIYIYLIR